MNFFEPLIALAVALQLAFLVAQQIQLRRQRAHQDELVEPLAGRHFWRVAFARPAYLARWFKLSPAEARGVLVEEPEHIRLQGRWQRGGETFDLRLPKAEAAAQWLGRPSLPAGRLPWARLHTPQGELMFTADPDTLLHPRPEALSDLLRSVFPQQAPPRQAVRDFALEKSPRAVGVIALFFALGAFAGIDSFAVNDFEWVQSQMLALATSPLVLGPVLAVLAACMAAVHLFLRAGQVPAQESWGLGLLLAFGLALAVGPAAKRVDRHFANEPTHHHAYRVVAPGVRLEPVDARLGLPNLRFTTAKEYWAQFKPGAEVKIPLLHGALGLWQLDHTQFDPVLDAFYGK